LRNAQATSGQGPLTWKALGFAPHLEKINFIIFLAIADLFQVRGFALKDEILCFPSEGERGGLASLKSSLGILDVFERQYILRTGVSTLDIRLLTSIMKKELKNERF